MKYMIASDLHGSAFWCDRLLQAFGHEKAHRLIFLGDILYHGPRNDLPDGYAPKTVISRLTPMANRLLCVRGNCEAEVDQMVLPFPVLAEYALLEQCGHLIYLTHGHHCNENALPPLSKGDVLLYGHTHVPICHLKDGILCMNPGSVSLPKEGSWHGYMTLENGLFLWKDFDGEIHLRYEMGGQEDAALSDQQSL